MCSTIHLKIIVEQLLFSPALSAPTLAEPLLRAKHGAVPAKATQRTGTEVPELWQMTRKFKAFHRGNSKCCRFARKLCSWHQHVTKELLQRFLLEHSPFPRLCQGSARPANCCGLQDRTGRKAGLVKAVFNSDPSHSLPNMSCTNANEGAVGASSAEQEAV